MTVYTHHKDKSTEARATWKHQRSRSAMETNSLAARHVCKNKTKLSNQLEVSNVSKVDSELKGIYLEDPTQESSENEERSSSSSRVW